MRIKNWEKALIETVNAHRGLPFDWKTNNCVQFARACGVAVTGASPLPDLDVADEDGANAEIAARGGDLADAVAATGLKRIPAAQAMRGDLGIVEQSGVKILVVVVDSFCAAPGPRCLRFISRTKLTDAFKVD